MKCECQKCVEDSMKLDGVWVISPDLHPLTTATQHTSSELEWLRNRVEIQDNLINMQAKRIKTLARMGYIAAGLLIFNAAIHLTNLVLK